MNEQKQTAKRKRYDDAFKQAAVEHWIGGRRQILTETSRIVGEAGLDEAFTEPVRGVWLGMEFGARLRPASVRLTRIRHLLGPRLGGCDGGVKVPFT
jgi:hypothetical protein